LQYPQADAASLRELFADGTVMAERHPQAMRALHGPPAKGSDPMALQSNGPAAALLALQQQRGLDVEGFVAQYSISSHQRQTPRSLPA
jgi:hypothetical protein